MNKRKPVWIEPIHEDHEVLARRDKFYTDMLNKAAKAGGKGIIGKPCNKNQGIKNYS